MGVEMQVEVINSSSGRVPRQFIAWACLFVQKELERRKKIKKLRTKTLTLVFLNKKEAKKLNQEFRGKDYATDVLSFESMEPSSLGELIFCYDVLRNQAKDHCLSFQFELGYMLIHGVLHLLGYEHEDCEEKAREMFDLQDSIFEKMCSKWKQKKQG